MVDKGVPIRLVVYTLAIGYMMLDLMVFEGPLYRHFTKKAEDSPEQIAAAKAQGIVAHVYNQPILETQVDRRVEMDLWREGRVMEDLSAEELRMRRRLALETLIDLQLLGRVKVHFSRDDYPVSEAEIDAAVARFVSRFATAGELEEAMKYQGWTEKELRYRLAARIQQERYLDEYIEQEVSEDEALAWYEENKEELAYPERVRARHIFIATLEKDANEVRQRLASGLSRLQAGEDFVSLAAKLSEDARTKSKGGELGWMQAGRLPEDFAKAVFALPVKRPRLVQTKLGWHLVEVLEKKPAEARSFGEAREEIIVALEATKRREGLKLYRRQLREFEKAKIKIYSDFSEK